MARLAGGGRSRVNRALRAELLQMARRDQAARAVVSHDGSGAVDREQALDRMIAIDRSNTARMREIVSDVGWPGRRAVGRRGARAAWLLAQHADQDTAFRSCAWPCSSGPRRPATRRGGRSHT